jgi:sigma-B regulation protein RsbU (phosphoserine phosphatase)
MLSGHFTSITARLIAWTLLACGSVFLVSTAVSNALSRRMAFAAAEREAESRAEAAALRVDAVLGSIEARTRLVGEAAGQLEPAARGDDGLLRRFLEGSPELHGAALLLGRERTSYVHRSADTPHSVVSVDPASARRDYEARDWYAAMLATGEARWSEPEHASDGSWLVTFAAPVRDLQGQVRGVVAAEASLGWLDRRVESVRIGRTGFGVLLSRSGRLLASSRASEAITTRPILEEMTPERRAELAPIVKRMLSGDEGFLPVDVQGVRYRLAYRPVGRAGWSVGVVYPETELFERVHGLWLVQATLGLTGLALLALVVVAVSHRITRPVKALAAGAARMATGDLESELPAVESEDELGALTQAFRHMRDALVAHIRELRETTAARERFESELRIARRIQADMLPSPLAGGPGEGYELAATLVAARAVGGDLFDHFRAGSRVFFLLGDVSGKGVGAALFMARAKTAFESLAARESDPGAILTLLNRRLSAENEAGMFVTAVLGSLDLTTGELTFAAAGHEPPVLLKVDGPPGSIEVEGGPVVGLLEGATFPVNRLRLAPGEALVLYTDGVSEARGSADELFGVERLLATLNPIAAARAQAVTQGVLAAVRAFAGEAPQSDDITILTLRFLG